MDLSNERMDISLKGRIFNCKDGYLNERNRMKKG